MKRRFQEETDLKDARMDTPKVITDDSRTASGDTVLSASVSPNQVSNVLRELDSYRRAFRLAFDEGFAAGARGGSIEAAWDISDARQSEAAFAFTRMSVGAVVNESLAWQPMSSPPSDCEPVLFYEPEQIGRHDGIIVSGYMHDDVSCDDSGRKVNASLWHPLPLLPERWE